MKLHIFNPEHDLALAANKSNYTAPHAGRQLRKDLGFIPALWADEGDLVLVDDIDDAYDKVRLLGDIYINKVEFITPQQLAEVFRHSMEVDSIHPWGWDKAVVSQLKHMGCPEIMLPTAENLELLRTLSGRRWAASHLQQNVAYVDNVEDLRQAVSERGQAVVKAPWSSSGRGVRYAISPCDEATEKWAANVIKQQGGITVEPYYNKVKDFGMEFEMRDGKVIYRGLSLFDTVKNAYTGNLLCSEEEKVEILQKYVNEYTLQAVRNRLISTLEPALKEVYSGPFGIDMMICTKGDTDRWGGTLAAEGDFEIVPCIELNLRRTMGHVALDLAKIAKDGSLMRVEYDGNRYHLRVLPGGKGAK